MPCRVCKSEDHDVRKCPLPEAVEVRKKNQERKKKKEKEEEKRAQKARENGGEREKEVPQKKRKVAVCSFCRQEGHNLKTCEKDGARLIREERKTMTPEQWKAKEKGKK